MTANKFLLLFVNMQFPPSHSSPQFIKSVVVVMVMMMTNDGGVPLMTTASFKPATY